MSIGNAGETADDQSVVRGAWGARPIVAGYVASEGPTENSGVLSPQHERQYHGYPHYENVGVVCCGEWI